MSSYGDQVHPRRLSDLLAPFATSKQFENLSVEAFDESVVTDSAWADFERNGDRGVLAAQHVLFFCSVFAPALAAALTGVRSGDAEAANVFGDRLENGLKKRLEAQPGTDAFVRPHYRFGEELFQLVS